MEARRFDAVVRAMANRSSRRVAVLGGLAAAVAGLGPGRPRRPGLAQDAASPVATPLAAPFASPVASPGPLDLLAGTPSLGGEVLGRNGGTCKGNREACATDSSIELGRPAPDAYATAECCSGTCRKRVGRIVIWSCD